MSRCNSYLEKNVQWPANKPNKCEVHYIRITLEVNTLMQGKDSSKGTADTIKEAKHYSIIADYIPYKSRTKQILLVIRFTAKEAMGYFLLERTG
jgi:hypothetical protein